MAENILTNQAQIDGVRSGEDITFTSNLVEVVLIDGLTAVKSADKTHWINGPLNYSVVITNNSGAAFEGGYFIDELNPTYITMDYAAGVYIDGQPAVFQFDASILKVTLPTIADGAGVVVTFTALRV